MNRKLPTLLLSLLPACTPTPPPHAGFDTVQSLLQPRTNQKVTWNQNTHEDQAAQDAIDHLLTHPLSPDDALSIALLHNPTLQAQYESVGIAQADLVQAGLLSNPSLSFSAQFPTNGGKTKLDGSLSQNLLGLLFTPLRKKLAASELQQAQLHTAHAVLQLTHDTQVAYYTCVTRQAQLTLRQQAQDAIDATLTLARRQHEAGTLTDLQLTTQQSQSHRATLDLAHLKLTLQSDQESLNRLMGLPTPPTRWTLQPLPSTLPPLRHSERSEESKPPATGPASPLESLALKNRLDLAAARADITLATTALSLSKDGILTDLTPGIGFERDTDNSLTIGPSIDLSLPLFDQGQARTPRLQSLLRQSERRAQALEVEIRSQVRQAAAQLDAAQSTLTLYHDTLCPEQKHLYDLTLLQFNAMQANLQDLLTARTTTLATQESYLDALKDYQTARADLERALGTRLPTPSPTTQPTTQPAPTPSPPPEHHHHD